MRVDTLPSPGLLANGIRVRIEAAKAISSVEINAGIPSNNGKSSAAKPLDEFFVACRAAIAGFIDTTVPTVASRSIGASLPKRITLAFSESIDPRFVPAASAFTITTQIRTIVKVTVDGPFVHLDVSAPFVPGAVNVAYTQPGSTTNLRDRSGNLVATFAAAAVVNSVV